MITTTEVWQSVTLTNGKRTMIRQAMICSVTEDELSETIKIRTTDGAVFLVQTTLDQYAEDAGIGKPQ